MVGKKFPINEKTGTLVPYNYQKKWNKKKVLAEYKGNRDVVLTLPGALKTSELAWLSIWCRKFKSDRGHVLFKDKGKLINIFNF